MKLILENWRRFLTEAAKGPVDLPENVFVRIEPTDADTFEIYYADEEGYYIEGKQNPVRGLIEIQETDEACGGAFTVVDSGAAKGWGPLLYDVAMEFATQLGGSERRFRAGTNACLTRYWSSSPSIHRIAFARFRVVSARAFAWP